MLRKGSLPHIAGGSYPQESQAPCDVFENGEVLTFSKSTLSLHGAFVSFKHRLPGGILGESAWIRVSQGHLFSRPQMMLCA